MQEAHLQSLVLVAAISFANAGAINSATTGGTSRPDLGAVSTQRTKVEAAEMRGIVLGHCNWAFPVFVRHCGHVHLNSQVRYGVIAFSLDVLTIFGTLHENFRLSISTALHYPLAVEISNRHTCHKFTVSPPSPRVIKLLHHCTEIRWRTFHRIVSCIQHRIGIMPLWLNILGTILAIISQGSGLFSGSFPPPRIHQKIRLLWIAPLSQAPQLAATRSTSLPPPA